MRRGWNKGSSRRRLWQELKGTREGRLKKNEVNTEVWGFFLTRKGEKRNLDENSKNEERMKKGKKTEGGVV